MIVGLDFLDIHMTSEEAIMIGITLTCCCANGTEHRWKTESVNKRTNIKEPFSRKWPQTASISLFLLVGQRLV